MTGMPFMFIPGIESFLARTGAVFLRDPFAAEALAAFELDEALGVAAAARPPLSRFGTAAARG